MGARYKLYNRKVYHVPETNSLDTRVDPLIGLSDCNLPHTADPMNKSYFRLSP